MKVLHVLNSKIYSGAEKVVSQIIEMFRGDDVEMVYCSRDSKIVWDILEEQGISYVSLNELTPAELGKVIREQKPDLIHAHDMRASFVAALCCGSIPLLSHIHNNAYDARGLSPKSIAYLLAGFKAKHIVWVSQSAYEGYCFHKLFAKKSSVLYNIIDLQQLCRKKAQDEKNYDYDIIYVGRLTEQKNPQRLMEVCAKVKERRPDIKMAVVGTGELEAETKQRCAELGLQDNVQFLGFQSNPIKMVHDAKVMLLASRWEGTPMCALEAMALGVPVVSTPADGMKDLIEDDVDGYLHDDDAVLAEKVLCIVEDPALHQRLAENAVRKSRAINDAKAYKAAIAACYQMKRK